MGKTGKWRTCKEEASDGILTLEIRSDVTERNVGGSSDHCLSLVMDRIMTITVNYSIKGN